MVNLKGIFPPLPTSFKENEDLYPEKVKENINYLLRFDLAGILILGSNGELVLMDENEKAKVYCSAREAIPDSKVMIAGTGGQSTRETIRVTRLAAKCGADAALVLNPSYYKGLMSKDVLIMHYFAVADASEIPIIIYNMPANSGMDLDADTIVSIGSHPNIIGVKDSGGNIVKMGDIIRMSDDNFQVLAGSASFLLPALAVGAIGGILALANIAPKLCLDIFNSFNEGDIELSRKLQHKAIPVNSAITKRWGIPALKAAMDYLGQYGGTVRKPLLSLTDDLKPELYRIVDKIK